MQVDCTAAANAPGEANDGGGDGGAADGGGDVTTNPGDQAVTPEPAEPITEAPVIPGGEGACSCPLETPILLPLNSPNTILSD